MTRNFFPRAFALIGLLVAAMVIMAMPVMAKQILLGPPDPDAEQGMDNWNHGASGTAYQFIDDTDTATGSGDFTLGNTNADRGNHTDWRSQIFPLGTASGFKPVTFSFSYKLTGAVKDGDNIRVQLRFYGKATNFIGQNEFLVGSASNDSEMTRYKKMIIKDIRVPKNAKMSDVTFSANYYPADRWSSGTARFDDFSVTAPVSLPLSGIVAVSATLLMVAGLAAWVIRRRSSSR